jgi:hypothetical protein
MNSDTIKGLFAGPHRELGETRMLVAASAFPKYFAVLYRLATDSLSTACCVPANCRT